MIDEGAYWLSDSGQLHYARFGHLDWIKQRVAGVDEVNALLDPETNRVSLTQAIYDRAYDAGWIRVVCRGQTLYFNYVGQISPVQRATLATTSAENGLRLVDWTIQDQE